MLLNIILLVCNKIDFLLITFHLGESLEKLSLMICRKEEGMLIQPTFNVSVIFGKRDEVRKPMLYSVPLVSIKVFDQLNTHLQPMLVACARQLIENIRYFPLILIMIVSHI